MSDLWEEIKQFWIKEDYNYLSYLKKQLQEFNKLYLKYFDKPLYREINTMVIEDIKNETEAANARLHKYQTNQRSIRYCLAGDPTTAG